MAMEGPELRYTEAIIDNGSFGKHVVRFESGLLARQANGSAAVYLDGDTMLLSATTAQSKPRDAIDFFPLTVDVEERMYAAGRIPGSFFRREGRPSTDAILTCRLIDRPLRPLFPEGFRNDVHVVGMTLSVDEENDPDVIALSGAGAALSISEIPFEGPIAGVRVGYVDGEFLINPTTSQLEQSTLDLVVAGTRETGPISRLRPQSRKNCTSFGPLRYIPIGTSMSGPCPAPPVIASTSALMTNEEKRVWANMA